jgi:hypothetical protein
LNCWTRKWLAFAKSIESVRAVWQSSTLLATLFYIAFVLSQDLFLVRKITIYFRKGSPVYQDLRSCLKLCSILIIHHGKTNKHLQFQKCNQYNEFYLKENTSNAQYLVSLVPFEAPMEWNMFAFQHLNQTSSKG